MIADELQQLQQYHQQHHGVSDDIERISFRHGDDGTRPANDSSR